MDPYTPNEWVKGQRVSAGKLNRLEAAVSTLSTSVGDGGTSAPAFADPVGQPSDVWVPVFGDDFDEAIQVVDAAEGLIKFGDNGPVWKTRYDANGDDGGFTNNGAKGLGWYTSDQVTQEGSTAFLHATYAPDAATRPNNPYKTGMLVSQDFTPTHGYFEARVRVSHIQGTWPAVWLTAKETWPPEIDILEQYGEVWDNKVTTWLNDTPGQTGSYNGQYIDSVGDWRVVACEWNADEVIFYYDGVEVARETNRLAVPDRPLSLLLDMQIDADQQGIDTAEYPTYFEVDYYRAWQKVEETEILAQENWSGAQGSALPAQWTFGGTGSNTAGTITINGDGTATLAPANGSYTLAPALYLSGMDPELDIRVKFDFEFSSTAEHYFDVTLRSDGTINESNNTPNHAYDLGMWPSANKYTLTRLDWGGTSEDIAGDIPETFAVSVRKTLIYEVNGGVIRSKIFNASDPEPLAWDVEQTLGIDKAFPVITDPGRVMISTLNGYDGTPHPVKLYPITVTKAVQPAPVPLEGTPGEADYVTHAELAAALAALSGGSASIPVHDLGNVSGILPSDWADWLTSACSIDMILTANLVIPELFDGTAEESFSVLLTFKQDGPGTHTVTFPSNVLWDGNDPVVAPYGNSHNVIRLTWTGTVWIGETVGLSMY